MWLYIIGYRVISELKIADYVKSWENKGFWRFFFCTYIVPLTNLNICTCVLESVILSLLPCYLDVVMGDLEQLIG